MQPESGSHLKDARAARQGDVSRETPIFASPIRSGGGRQCPWVCVCVCPRCLSPGPHRERCNDDRSGVPSRPMSGMFHVKRPTTRAVEPAERRRIDPKRVWRNFGRDPGRGPRRRLGLGVEDHRRPNGEVGRVRSVVAWRRAGGVAGSTEGSRNPSPNPCVSPNRRVLRPTRRSRMATRDRRLIASAPPRRVRPPTSIRCCDH